MPDRILSFRNALNEALREEMEQDPQVFLMGEEVGVYQGAYKVTQGLLEKFGPKRIIDTPISEEGFIGLGVGAALNGLRPIVEVMTFNFSLVGIDPIINSAAKIHFMSGGQFPVPLVIRGPTGSSGQLAAQHTQNFEGWYANCPGLKVVVPSTPYDAKGLLKSAIRDDDPVLFMESEQLYGDEGPVPDMPYYLPIGQATIRREGTAATLVSFGKIMKVAEEAIQELAAAGYSIEMIDLRSIRPLDLTAVIQSVQKTHRLVIVEEAWPLGGVASEIAYQVQKNAFDTLDAPIQKVSSLDVPLAFSAPLMEASLPSVQRVVQALRQVLYLD